MGIPVSEVGYTPAMPRREDHEVHKGHVVALDPKKNTMNRGSGIVIWQCAALPMSRYIVLRTTTMSITQSHAGYK